MSATWTHWDEAFLAADKEPEKRLMFTLTPPLFERALVSLAVEHGWLPKSDPRYQEACRSGRLEWWDGRGRSVTIIREGSWAAAEMAREAHPPADPFPFRPDPEPLVPDLVVAGGFLPKSIAAELEQAGPDPSVVTTKAETVQAFADAVNAAGGGSKATANLPDFVTITSERASLKGKGKKK